MPAELSAQAARQSVQVSDLLPRELWSVSASLDRVLDLTDESVLDSLGVRVEDLVRRDHAFTQQTGEAAHERQVQGIKSPSATGVDQVLAVLPEHLGTITLQVELVQVWSSVQDNRMSHPTVPQAESAVDSGLDVATLAPDQDELAAAGRA